MAPAARAAALPWRRLGDLDWAALRRLQLLAASRPPPTQPAATAAAAAGGHPPAAVALLTFDGPAGASVLLLRKTGRGRHAAQLCLPGGFADAALDGGDLRLTAARELEEETGLSEADRGLVELIGAGPLGVFTTQRTGIEVTAYAGCFDYFDSVYRPDVCCGGGGPTMGLPVDRKEIDRVLAVPIDMLCSARYAKLEDSYSPAAARPTAGGDEANPHDSLWSGFMYTGPVFKLGSQVGKLASDNGRTQPIIWGLTARILAGYLTTLAEVAEEHHVS